MSNRLRVYTDDVYLLIEDDSDARIYSDKSFLLFAHQAHGLHLVRGLTLEAEGARVAKFVDRRTEP